MSRSIIRTTYNVVHIFFDWSGDIAFCLTNLSCRVPLDKYFVSGFFFIVQQAVYVSRRGSLHFRLKLLPPKRCNKVTGGDKMLNSYQLLCFQALSKIPIEQKRKSPPPRNKRNKRAIHWVMYLIVSKHWFQLRLSYTYSIWSKPQLLLVWEWCNILWSRGSCYNALCTTSWREKDVKDLCSMYAGTISANIYT